MLVGDRAVLADNGWRNYLRHGYQNCVLDLAGLHGGGSTVKDFSGQGNDGTITGATWQRTKDGLWYLNYDGDDKVDCGSGSSLDFITENFSIECWLYLNAAGQNGIVASRGLYQTDGYVLSVYANDRIRADVWQSLAEQTWDSAAGSLTGTTWYHVVSVRNGTAGLIYLNGADATSTSDTILDPTTASRSFVVANYATTYLNGKVKSLRAYNIALSADEIAQHYQIEKRFLGV